MTFPVVEAEAREVVAEIVKSPVVEANVRLADDVAPPPNIPKSNWESIPLLKKVSEEVLNLLPLESKSEFATVSVPIVEEGERNSVEDANPMGLTVKKNWPEEDSIPKRLAV